MIPTAAMNAKFIEELNARVVSFLQQTPAAEISQNIKAALTASFSKLDLVTREDFDVQAQVLARTRDKLAALEARVAELERQASNS
jgi:BMFP domain-containing protein YqiC